MSGAADAATTSAATVDAVVRAGGPRLAHLLERTEARLAELAAGHGETLARHATATISAGGKRLRPLLVFLAAGEALDAAAEARLVRAAAAVELVHSASLVHDDVLDAASLRRGIPTVVAAAGRTTATATGDLLFSRAFADLAAAGELEDVRALSAAASALAAGELMQRADGWARSRPAAPLTSWHCSAGGSGSPSSCSTTCSTSPGPRAAPARRAAPTCSTGPSRCR